MHARPQQPRPNFAAPRSSPGACLGARAGSGAPGDPRPANSLFPSKQRALHPCTLDGRYGAADPARQAQTAVCCHGSRHRQPLPPRRRRPDGGGLWSTAWGALRRHGRCSGRHVGYIGGRAAAVRTAAAACLASRLGQLSLGGGLCAPGSCPPAIDQPGSCSSCATAVPPAVERRSQHAAVRLTMQVCGSEGASACRAAIVEPLLTSCWRRRRCWERPSSLLQEGSASIFQAGYSQFAVLPPLAQPPSCSVGTARLQLPVGRRRLVTAAAAEDAAEHECSVHYDGSDAVGVGSLFEFERGQQYYVGRAIKTLAQGWQVEAER